MVEQNTLDAVFRSLSNPTRRDILFRLRGRQQTITQLAHRYSMSFAATAKHVRILEGAELVTKSRNGKEQVVSIRADNLAKASKYLQDYAALWNNSLNRMEGILIKGGTHAG